MSKTIPTPPPMHSEEQMDEIRKNLGKAATSAKATPAVQNDIPAVETTAAALKQPNFLADITKGAQLKPVDKPAETPKKQEEPPSLLDQIKGVNLKKPEPQAKAKSTEGTDLKTLLEEEIAKRRQFIKEEEKEKEEDDDEWKETSNTEKTTTSATHTEPQSVKKAETQSVNKTDKKPSELEQKLARRLAKQQEASTTTNTTSVPPPPPPAKQPPAVQVTTTTAAPPPLPSIEKKLSMPSVEERREDSTTTPANTQQNPPTVKRELPPIPEPREPRALPLTPLEQQHIETPVNNTDQPKTNENKTNSFKNIDIPPLNLSTSITQLPTGNTNNISKTERSISELSAADTNANTISDENEQNPEQSIGGLPEADKSRLENIKASLSNGAAFIAQCFRGLAVKCGLSKPDSQVLEEGAKQLETEPTKTKSIIERIKEYFSGRCNDTDPGSKEHTTLQNVSNAIYQAKAYMQSLTPQGKENMAAATRQAFDQETTESIDESLKNKGNDITKYF